MSTLPTSLLSTASPSFGADAARANSARPQAAGGSFSQLLRGFDKPPAMDSKPSPADAAPASKPSAEPPAPPHPSTADGKTETQRQDAKLKPTPKQSEPNAPKDAKGPVTAAEADSAIAAPAATDDSLVPTEARADDDTAETGEAGEAGKAGKSGKAAKADQTALAIKADDTSAAIAPPAAALPLPLPVAPPLSPPQARLSAADQAPAAEGDSATQTEADVKPKSAAKTAAAARALDTMPGNDGSSSSSKAADFASIMQDAAQAAPTLARTASEATSVRPAPAAIDGLLSAAAPGAQSPMTAHSSEVSSPPVVSLAQPLYEAGFAPELAARLSLMAADGVQEAQLHLNPAEMGPVAVQIVVEGQQAHISFHADQADTRAVLERSLPDLAAALRDSGLTLSGGGVFQQSAGQDRQAETGGQPAQRQRSRDASDALPSLSRTAPPPRASRGVVDLYA